MTRHLAVGCVASQAKPAGGLTLQGMTTVPAADDFGTIKFPLKYHFTYLDVMSHRFVHSDIMSTLADAAHPPRHDSSESRLHWISACGAESLSSTGKAGLGAAVQAVRAD